MSSKYNYFIANFRAFSIFFVVVSHSMVLPLVDSTRFFTFLFVDATTWFVFIGGFLFYLLESARFDYAKYLLKKLRNVICPYLFISAILIFFGVYSGRNEVMHMTPFSYVLWSLIVGGALLGPLWYVPMVALYFLIAPILLFISRSRFFVFLVGLSLLVSFFTFRPLYSLNPFLSGVHFLGFYVLGMYFAKIFEHVGVRLFLRMHANLIVALSLFGFVVCWLLVPISDVGAHGFFSKIFVVNYLQISKLFLLVGIFAFFEKYLNKNISLLGRLAEDSFGVFFLHAAFLIAFRFVMAALNVKPTWWWLFGEIFFALSLSIFSVHMVRVILNRRSRYVIGC